LYGVFHLVFLETGRMSGPVFVTEFTWFTGTLCSHGFGEYN
jgi:hypothetical protein